MNKLKLTPAESYLLLDIENKDGKTLMKYSLINLLYKKVLSSEVREETEGTVFKNVVKKTYLSKGSQFGKLNLKVHEKLLCSVIADEEDEIELVEFIKKIFEYGSIFFIFFISLIEEASKESIPFFFRKLMIRLDGLALNA